MYMYMYICMYVYIYLYVNMYTCIHIDPESLLSKNQKCYLSPLILCSSVRAAKRRARAIYNIEKYM